MNKNSMKQSFLSHEKSSNIILNSNSDSIAMIKTKNFLSESLNPSKDLEGTIIFGTTSSEIDPNLQEILLNIHTLGWVYIKEGWKDENK